MRCEKSHWTRRWRILFRRATHLRQFRIQKRTTPTPLEAGEKAPLHQQPGWGIVIPLEYISICASLCESGLFFASGAGLQGAQVCGDRLRIRAVETIFGHWGAGMLAIPIDAGRQEFRDLLVGPAVKPGKWRGSAGPRHLYNRLEHNGCALEPLLLNVGAFLVARCMAVLAQADLSCQVLAALDGWIEFRFRVGLRLGGSLGTSGYSCEPDEAHYGDRDFHFLPTQEVTQLEAATWFSARCRILPGAAGATPKRSG